MKSIKPVALLAAFVSGLLLSPVLGKLVAPVHAESAPLSAFMLNLFDMKREDLTIGPFPDFRARNLVVTENATVGVQSGNVPKHMHPMTDEIQYIIEGSGSMWLGDERKEFGPGTLIVIPKGTAHAGSIVANGPVKALVIKIPPQGREDTVFLH